MWMPKLMWKKCKIESVWTKCMEVYGSKHWLCIFSPSKGKPSAEELREPGTCELCMWCFTGGAYTSDEVSQVSVLINYQNHNISDCLSQNWIESNQIGDQINNRKQWWYPVLVFQTLFIYWTLPAQPSPGFTEKGPKKRTYPASLLSESTLLMSDVRGEWPHY